MRPHIRPLPAGGLLAASLLAATAIAAAAATPVKLTNCTTASVRPAAVTLTCADGNAALSDLRWSSFGGATARAQGTFRMNTCCALKAGSGRRVRVPSR